MRLLSVVTVVSFLLAVAAPVVAQKASSDDALHDKIIERLAADRDVKGGGIDVEVKDGVVTLRGKVREYRQKAKAERITRKVQGVKQVVNELVVEFGAQPAAGEAKPAR
jgi:osmotically-inducible protein OsmY